MHPVKARAENRTIRLGAQILEMTGDLLPTPDAYAGSRGGSQHPDKKRAGGHQVMLADVAEKGLRLLPTPNTMDHLPAREGEALEKARRRGDGRQKPSTVQNLRERVIDDQSRWGKYAPAIERWEKVLGRSAPEPTQPSRAGKPQLSSRFVEWMMGLPAGWVTDLGLSRPQELRMLGNGVVPQQAVAALVLLKGGSGE